MSRGHDSENKTSQGRSRTGRSKADRNNRSRQMNPNDLRYQQSRQANPSNKSSSSKSTSGPATGWREKMMAEDAVRIQSHSDRTGTNQDFKERSQRAAEKNKDNKKLIRK